MQTISGIFALAILFAVFIWYHFFFAPKKGSAIASGRGYDYKKWNFYIWTFGIFAILYLYVSLDPLHQKERRSLFLLMSGYVLIFCGAVWVDVHFKF